jgi:hypothetical protein
VTEDGGGSETQIKSELNGWITEHRTTTTNGVTSHDVRQFR